MKSLIPKLIIFFSLIIYSSALSCSACANCHGQNATIIKLACSPGQNFCYTLKSGSTIRAGCAAACQEDENTTCCTTDGCNSRLANKLTCLQCENCRPPSNDQTTCGYKQTICYTEQYGNRITAGCAEKCEPGPTKTCCFGNLCNKDVNSTFTCKQFNSLTSYNNQTCSSEENFCYQEQKGNIVSGGCAKECEETENKKCCSTKNCNEPITKYNCITCKNCLYTARITSEPCKANENLCQVERYGDFNTTVDAGCVATCKTGATCCNTNNCNTLPEALFCNSCQNCSYNETISTKCRRDQTFCFTETISNTANAGCAETCDPSHDDASNNHKTCCKTKNCNTVPTPFTCNSCTNCSFTSLSREVCKVNQKFCYVDENGKDVTAGCTETCTPSATRKCCDSGNCNKLPEPFQCYSCPSCKYFAPVLRKCGYLDTFCYRETNSSGSFIEKGCASKCEETTYKKCCTTTGCNHSSSIMGLNLIYLFSLVLFQFYFLY